MCITARIRIHHTRDCLVLLRPPPGTLSTAYLQIADSYRQSWLHPIPSPYRAYTAASRIYSATALSRNGFFFKIVKSEPSLPLRLPALPCPLSLSPCSHSPPPPPPPPLLDPRPPPLRLASPLFSHTNLPTAVTLEKMFQMPRNAAISFRLDCSIVRPFDGSSV